MKGAGDTLDQGNENENPIKKKASDDRICRLAPRNTWIRTASCWYGISLLAAFRAAFHTRSDRGGDGPVLCDPGPKVGQKEGRGLLLQNGFAMDPVCGCLPRANSQANVMTSACKVCVSDPNALGICLCFRREPRSRVDANFDHIRNVVVAAGF